MNFYEAANTIFALITHARSSGAINWFWEPSSIFNPSSGSAGRVKTSLKTRTRVEFGTFKVQAEAWKTCWQLIEPIQPGQPFNSCHPGRDVCQCLSLAFHLLQSQRNTAELWESAAWRMYVSIWTHTVTFFERKQSVRVKFTTGNEGTEGDLLYYCGAVDEKSK